MFQYRKRYSPVQQNPTRRDTRIRRSFNTASGIRLCNGGTINVRNQGFSFNTASGIRLCNVDSLTYGLQHIVSIPQAVFACATFYLHHLRRLPKFQYRKRYSPVQPRDWISSNLKNQFQYRKRYSPVQRHLLGVDSFLERRFNTASGIRLCNKGNYKYHQMDWGFNTASGIRLCNGEKSWQ